MSSRAKILAAASELFDEAGYDHVTVADVRAKAGVSNGSFFHAFPSKERLAAELYFQALCDYHQAMLHSLEAGPSAAAGVAALIEAHLGWVTKCPASARFLFEQARAAWMEPLREKQSIENVRFSEGIGLWRDPLTTSGALLPLPSLVLFSQIIGPAQIFCRAWLSGRDAADPRRHLSDLVDCAIRAVVA